MELECVNPTPIVLPPESRFLAAAGGIGPAATFFSVEIEMLALTPIIPLPESRSSSAGGIGPGAIAFPCCAEFHGARAC
jgi:hypothetical protein